MWMASEDIAAAGKTFREIFRDCFIARCREVVKLFRLLLLPCMKLLSLCCPSYFEKMKVGLCDHHAVCVSVYSLRQLLNV
jgi:hypothetical protein